VFDFDFFECTMMVVIQQFWLGRLTFRGVFMATAFNEFALSADAYPNGRIAVLLARYPRLADTELDELVSFARRAAPEELRHLRTVPTITGKLDRLIRDHPDQLPQAPQPLAWFAVAALLVLAAFQLL
jgi:hypothetical protein